MPPLGRRRLGSWLYAALLVTSLGGCATSGPSGDVAAPAPPTRDTASLIGLDSEDLLARFGPPELLRRERRAEYWRYRHQSCFIDLYLYADPPMPQPRTIHVGVRKQSGGNALEAAACGASLADFATRTAADLSPVASY